MSEKTGLRIVRSFVDTAERISNNVCAACIVAVFLGTAIENAALADSLWGAIGFLGISLVANAFLAILDTLIANVEETKEQ